MKYVATVDGHEYHVELSESGEITLDGTPIAVDLQSVDGGFHYSLLAGAASYEIFVEHCDEVCFVDIEGQRCQVRVQEEHLLGRGERLGRAPQEIGTVQVPSPMPGVVVAVLVEEGQAVSTGEGLAILEAMKMENEIRAPLNGVVEQVWVTPGQRVSQDEVLMRISSMAASR